MIPCCWVVHGNEVLRAIVLEYHFTDIKGASFCFALTSPVYPSGGCGDLFKLTDYVTGKSIPDHYVSRKAIPSGGVTELMQKMISDLRDKWGDDQLHADLIAYHAIEQTHNEVDF